MTYHQQWEASEVFSRYKLVALVGVIILVLGGLALWVAPASLQDLGRPLASFGIIIVIGAIRAYNKSLKMK